VIQRSELCNAALARWMPLLALSLSFIFTGCSPSGGSDPAPTRVTFLNVELYQDTTLYQNGMFQLYLNRTLEGTPNDWRCVMTLPSGDPQNACASALGGYDASTKKAQLHLLVNGNPATLDLNFKELRNIEISLDIGDNNPRTGRARIASTNLVYDSRIDDQGNKTLHITLNNIPPLNNVGDASAFDSGDLFVTPSSDTSIYTLLGSAHRWSADYTTTYKHYRLTPFDNGYPQGFMGYVEYSGALNGVSADPNLVAGTYTWVVCAIAGAPDCRDAAVIGAYTTGVAIAEGSLDPQAADGVIDNSKLYAFASLPAAVANISLVNQAATSFTSLSTDPAAATDVGAGPYQVTWLSSEQNPTAVDWQAIFTPVDNSGAALDNFSEIRSPRLHHGETGGPIFDSNATSYTWDLDPGLSVSNGVTMKVVLRANNTTRIYSADTQAFYITCSTC